MPTVWEPLRNFQNPFLARLYYTLPICCVLCLLFGFIWLHILTVPDPSVTSHYTIGVWSIAISCIMEMCCEPLYLVAQAFLFVRLRVVCESVIVFVRTATFTVLVLSWSSRGAVIAFSAAQLLSIGAYTVTLYMYFWWYLRQRALGPGGTCLTGDRTMDETKSSSSSVSSSREGNASESNRKVPPLERRQSLEEDFPFRSLRDFLPKRLENDSQMDTKLLRLTWSFMKQGLLKQLLTDGERYVMTIFTLLSFAEQGTFDVVNNLGSLAARFLFRPIEESCYFYFSQVVQRDAPIKKQSQTSMQEAARVLEQVLHCVTSLGLVVLVFGQSYSRLLLLLYGGPSLAVSGGLATLLLRTHCLAVLFLAVNGTTECYALATMDTYQIDRYNKTMVYLSIAFLATRLVLSEYYLYESSKVYHFLVGAVCFSLVIVCWVREEAELVPLIMSKIKGSKSE
ncbi:hypothetical protein WDU94_001766 [Cyamophila willieti]